MLEYLPMSIPTTEELLERFGPVDDPEIEARRQLILRALLKTSPETQQQLMDQGRAEGLEKGLEKGLEQGRLTGIRAALRRVLARRELVLRPIDDARIEACPDLATLERWLDQAITARSAAEAMR
jgi:flagellar biosynthesis/type III secretory pathway protein FliH